MTTMNAMVLEAFGQPLVPRRVAIPTAGAGEVLVRVRACGVCFTDTKIIAGKMPNTAPLPLIPGHEVAGEVTEVGTGLGTGAASQATPGQRVSVNFYLTCGTCRYCRTGSETLCVNLRGQLGRSVNGGYAEFLKVPAENCLPLPPEIPFEHGAVLADAVATSLHAVRERARVRPGETVGIVGIGGVGINLLQMARLAGGRVVAMDLREQSLSLAREYGAEETLLLDGGDPEPAIRQFTDGLGLDAILDTVGTQATLSMGLAVLARRGRLVLVGYDPSAPFSAQALGLVLNEHTIMGTRAATKVELADAIALVKAGRVTPVVTTSRPLSEANGLLEQLRAGQLVGRGVLLP